MYSPERSPERVIALMYHRVGTPASAADRRYCITPQRFAEQMQALERAGYRAVPADALVEWVETGMGLRPGDFALTFDDGFLGVREHALPVLQALRWTASVFLVTDLVGNTDQWHRAADSDSVPQRLLDVGDIRDLQRHGWTFHSHTGSHASLPSLDDQVLRSELTRSRSALDELVGKGPRYLAYPYGHVDDRVETEARAAGYRCAFSVQPGFNRRDVNPFRLRRLDVFGFDTGSALLRKVHFGSNDGSLYYAAAYRMRRAISRLSVVTP